MSTETGSGGIDGGGLQRNAVIPQRPAFDIEASTTSVFTNERFGITIDVNNTDPQHTLVIESVEFDGIGTSLVDVTPPDDRPPFDVLPGRETKKPFEVKVNRRRHVFRNPGDYQILVTARGTFKIEGNPPIPTGDLQDHVTVTVSPAREVLIPFALVGGIIGFLILALREPSGLQVPFTDALVEIPDGWWGYVAAFFVAMLFVFVVALAATQVNIFPKIVRSAVGYGLIGVLSVLLGAQVWAEVEDVLTSDPPADGQEEMVPPSPTGSPETSA